MPVAANATTVANDYTFKIRLKPAPTYCLSSPTSSLRPALPAPPALLAPQIAVVLVDPVGTRRIEDVQINGVGERFDRVRHVGRNGQQLTGRHDDLSSIDAEFQCTLE